MIRGFADTSKPCASGSPAHAQCEPSDCDDPCCERFVNSCEVNDASKPITCDTNNKERQHCSGLKLSDETVVEHAPVYANTRALSAQQTSTYTDDVECINSVVNKPAKEDVMGNIFGRKKKKKEKYDEDDGQLWKRRNTNDSTTSSGSAKNKKDKKKHKNKSLESPSSKRANVNSLKGKDCKDRYAMYEPDQPCDKANCHSLPTRIGRSKKNAQNLPVGTDPSEFRKSIGDPMDFRMADDVSSAGSPGYMTPDTATPPATRTALFRNLNQRDHGVEHGGQRTPKLTPKLPPKVTPKLCRKDKPSAGESSDDSKYSTAKGSLATPSPSLTPKFSPLRKRKNETSESVKNTNFEPLTGSPRPRGYILPSPPSRPKFVNTRTANEIPDSPKLLRSGLHRMHAEDVLLEKSGSASPKLTVTEEQTEIPIYKCINKTKGDPNIDKNKGDPNILYKNSNETAFQSNRICQNNDTTSSNIQVEDENEINMRKEELRKMATLSAEKDTEECQVIRETIIDSVEPITIESDKFEVRAVPKIAVLSTIPPPEKAVLSHVPPPSPSSMGILCEEEENEDAEEEVTYNQKNHRLSKEAEEFGDIVCQRLSQLLEIRKDSDRTRTLNTSLVPTSESISPSSPGLYSHRGGTDSDNVISDDSNRQSENLYKEKEIPHKTQVLEISKPSILTCELPLPPLLVKSPQGEHEASVLDMANNNFRLETNKSAPLHVQNKSQDAVEDPGSESDISSSESSYSNELDFSSDNDLGLPGDDDGRHDETTYSVPWDLVRYRTDSYTDEGLDFSDDQLYEESENVARSIDVNQSSFEREIPPSLPVKKSHEYKKYLKTIGAQKSCDSVDEPRIEKSAMELKHEAMAKHLKDILDMKYTSMESVNEQMIEPMKIKRDFSIPKRFSKEESDFEVEEEVIKPRRSGSSENSILSKRESSHIRDVIDAYTGEEEEKVKEEISVKRKIQAFEQITAEQLSVTMKKPSALDKSIQKIFLQQEDVDELYPELAPLHSLIQGAMDAEPSSEPYQYLKEGDMRGFTRLPIGHKRFGSSTFTESDLDMSEQRDDVSSDSMDADDEEDDNVDEDSRESEAMFSKPLPRKGGKVLVSRAVLSSNSFRDPYSETDNDSVFLDEDDRHPGNRHWRESDDLPSPEEDYHHDRWQSEDLSSTDDFGHEIDLGRDQRYGTDRDLGQAFHDSGPKFVYEQCERLEETAWQHEELPPTPLSAPPYFSIPPPPSHPPPPLFSDDPHFALDLASTYHVIGPPTEAAGVVFDDARKQMEDIHVHLRNLREQMTHLHGDEDPRNQSRRREDTRHVYTD